MNTHIYVLCTPIQPRRTSFGPFRCVCVFDVFRVAIAQKRLNISNVLLLSAILFEKNFFSKFQKMEKVFFFSILFQLTDYVLLLFRNFD